jgi:N-formylglutamate amidohydrolase
MSHAPLPIILSRPHGGLVVPPEVQGRLAIDATTVYNECDLWVEQLFDFAHADLHPTGALDHATGVLAAVDMPIARVLVDVNRPPDDLHDPDGPIKRTTSYGEAIYRAPLTLAEQQELRARYWQPFHTALDRAVMQHTGACKLILDCHNMAQIGPLAYGDPGALRPLLCLANLGDAQGEPVSSADPVSCPPELLQVAGRLADTHFAGCALLKPGVRQPPTVQLNVPFRGGYIVRRMRDLTRSQIPVIMLEVNRGLFVGPQNSRTPIAPANHHAIRDLRRRLFTWAEALVDLLQSTSVP